MTGLLSFFAIVYAVLVFVISGMVIARALGSRQKFEQMALSFLLSSSAFTYGWFLLYDFFHFSFTPLHLFILFTVVGVATYVFAAFFKLIDWKSVWEYAQQLLQKSFASRKEDIFSFVCMCSTIVLALFTLIQNVFWPVADWDSIALYDFRAKVFAMTGGMEEGIARGYFLHYPLYTSLLHTINYLFGFDNGKFWYTIMFVSLLTVFYYLLRRDMSRRLSLLGMLFLALSPRILQHAQMSYTNLPHAIFLSLGYIYLLHWLRKGIRKDLLIGAFLIAFSTWIRLTEPLWLFAYPLLFVGLLKYRRQIPLIIVAGAFIFFLQYPWNAFVLAESQVSPVASIGLLKTVEQQFSFGDLINRIKDVLFFLAPGVFAMIQPYVWSLLLSFAFLLYIRNWPKVFEYLFFFGLLAMIIAGTFLFSYIFPGWKDIPDSAARMAMFLLPLCIYFIMRSDLWELPARKISRKR